MAGANGTLGIRLAAPVVPTSVTIDHIARERSHSVASTPKDLELWVRHVHVLSAACCLLLT